MAKMFIQILKSILSKLGESFLSKMVEQTADSAHINVNNIKDFELILKALQKKLKALCAKASDIKEEIKNAELSGRKKRKREVEEWLEEVRSIETEVVELGTQVESEGFMIRLMEGGKVAQLNERVDKLVEQRLSFGELVLDICGIRGETLLTNGMVGEAFNENLETILKVLEAGQVSSIGVYGMGGVGKTTLAKHIHNRLLQQSQGCVIWVTVSQEFSILSLQDKIARFARVELMSGDNEDIRAARLNRTLSQMKNSVLILDDVWENIDMLKVGCSVSVECCRLIITTRSLEVCRRMCCQKVIPVENLRHHEAWELFNGTLRNEIELDPPIQDIAKSMADLCGGLPLGIITVAGSMRGVRSIHTWENAIAELKERVAGKDGMEEDDVYRVLRYSFDRLNMNHHGHGNEFNIFQHCFLYCALYPEDKEIDREHLVRRFISGGLLDERKRRRPQIHQGHSILDKLVNVCLLESCIVPDEFGPNECVRMHDLVRGMALKIGEGKYMVRAGDESLTEIPSAEEWTDGLEKVSLMNCGIRRIEDGISPDCPKLSTLLLCCHWLKVIPNSFFSKMQGLCTLDLSGAFNIEKLPNSIFYITSLKALLLGNCHNLKYVPYLGKLEALQELNLSGTAINEVPQGLEELLNLKFLSIEAHNLKMLPRGLLLKLGHLQHVDVPFHIQVPIEEIENMRLLEEFSGRVGTLNDFNCFIRSWESRVHDTCYTIGVGSYDLTIYPRRGSCYNKELFLSECNLKDERVLGHDIMHLSISKCESLSISFLDDFSGLKRLRIKSCGGIECVWRTGQGLSSQMSTLEQIDLVELEALKGVVEKGEIGASAAPVQLMFLSLTQLTIDKCNKMRKVGLPVLGVPNLEKISISSCEEIEEIFEDEGSGCIALPKLQCLWLHELPRLRNVGLSILSIPNLELIQIRGCGEMEEIFEDEGRGSVSLPKFKQLSLEDVPRLKHICKARVICNSIFIIFIRKCPKLMKKLPVSMNARPLMKIVMNRDWWESLEWNNPNSPQFLQHFFDLRDCPDRPTPM